MVNGRRTVFTWADLAAQLCLFIHLVLQYKTPAQMYSDSYSSGTVNSKSFVSRVLLRIKWKFELTVFELTVPDL